ncbi:DUF3137 domain-containing protein [Microbacterium sp. H1-D42]|uniref:DUF3137 domain-containing protein n=1 Tax=Microbacterium sp. H1-D42 TaxID=2925844 RepID=UPI001F5305BE|nr:DUF3137 domain-containing protein [Microbacterium sp. H1-D42]UNK70914.1 DUF3137 domain-containing protein [Microbacterium sp. H1-D42]
MPERTARAFDPRPLTDPVDPRAVRSFWRDIKAQHPRSTAQVVTLVAGAIIAVVVGVVLLGVLSTMTAIIGAGIAQGGFSPLVLVPLLFVAVAVAVGISAFVTSQRTRRNRYRIARFAAANGMTYVDRVSAPNLPGLIFPQGSARLSTALVRGFQPRFVEFANYQYTTGSGKDSTTHHWGYVAVKLDVPLPNIVLDAKGNNALGSNLPASFQRGQRLSLEGDFDRHFALYCPAGYEADALYLFTPDIMARFIDHAAQLDVEIVDDWLFLYMQRPASTVDPATWAWLFGTVGALLTKLDQWARWRDERLRQAGSDAVASSSTPADAPTAPALPFAPPAGMLAPPPGVAPEGRRLKRSTKSVVFVGIAVFGFIVFQNVIVPLLSR